MWRIVSTLEWDLTKLEDQKRRAHLLDTTTPLEIADALYTEATSAAVAGLICLSWQEACERPGYFRLEASIPINSTLFDRLFNGRAGYRAQYYLSPEEGILYNRLLVDRLVSPIRAAHKGRPLSVPFEDVEQTLLAPHAKLWISNERHAFDEALPEILNPPRWVTNHATRGRKAPLPSQCEVDLKGAFLSPGGQELFVDELKLDRAWDLHLKGST